MNDNELIIKLLEKKRYSGKNLLDKLQQIYEGYKAQKIKTWEISKKELFLTLKDTIWFNFEHKINYANLEQAKGLRTLKYYGTKFPGMTHIFDTDNYISNKYLQYILKELDEIIELWKIDKLIYLANIYTDSNIEIKCGQNASKIIIYENDEKPVKYCTDCINQLTSILNVKGEKQIIPKKKYVYCVLQGPLDEYEQNKIYFHLLIDLQNNIKEAIRYNKDLELIIQDI